ncbi:MAG: hypothetical protein DHS20C11_30030 [Lysobacteraceae bacterium]|nr:MAG: hypothetical protein DHS20C11_30030 [Xanthomonadaceae bacterium]
MTTAAQQYKIPMLVFGTLFLAWGLFGWIEITNLAQGGYDTDGNNTVTQVLPGSPSEEAGLKVGDFVASVDGIATSDAEALSNRPRPVVGETRRFSVERDGASMDIDITFGEPVAERQFLAHAGQFIGFCFLVFAFMAYLKRPSDVTLTLAFTGLCLAMAFLIGPYFESATVRSAINALLNVIVFLGVGSLLHFLLLYPSTHPFLSKPNAKLMLYAPALVAGLFLAYRVIVTPAATSGLNTFTNILTGAVIVFYLLGSLVRIFNTYRSASVEERSSKGINLMLIGTLIALGPVMISSLVGIFSPQTVLPGENYYSLTVVLLPITWSIAAMRTEA